MANVKVAFNMRDLERLRRDLRATIPKFHRAFSLVINDVTRMNKTDSSKAIKQTYSLSSKAIKEDIQIVRRANKTKQYSKTTYSLRPKPLTLFNPRVKRIKGRKGLSIKIKKRRKNVVNSFMIGNTVYKRTGFGKYSIKKLYTSRTGDVVQNDAIQRHMKRFINATFARKLGAKVDFVMGRVAKKSR